VIPGNDDALRAIRLFASKIADAVINGRGLREAVNAEDAAEADGDETRRQKQQRRPRVEPAPTPASA